MYKLFRTKKGIAIDDLLPLLFAIVVFVIVVLILIGTDINNKKKAIVDIRTRINGIEGHEKLIDFLETQVKVNKKDMRMGALISFYCNAKKRNDLDKVRIYSAAQQILPLTTTAKLICSKNDGLLLRRLLCNAPSSIKIPSISGKPNEIQYCTSIQLAEKAGHYLLVRSIKTHDGKYWSKRKLGGVTYYTEDDTGTFLTVEEFDRTYAGYKESEEYEKRVEQFLEDIKTKSSLEAPDGSVWAKMGNNWVMQTTIRGGPPDKDVILSTEKLIETKGEVPEGTIMEE